MLRDKDLAGVLRELTPRITRWHLATLSGPRGAEASELMQFLPGKDVQTHASPSEAFEAAKKRAGQDDKIVVFGSFFTVGEVMTWLHNNKTSKR
jgi:dihydrofolate synthase/folylpolyglutamate synthase